MSNLNFPGESTSHQAALEKLNNWRRHVNGKGTWLKLFVQLFWWSPHAHVRQLVRNAFNPSFWRYGFRKHWAVERKSLSFWHWISLNRDMQNTAECPGWQWWYYELKGWDYTGASVDPMGGDQKDAKLVLLRNYRRFPIMRSAVDCKYMHEGMLRNFSLDHEAYHAA